MTNEQLERMQKGQGFIAALDQSGGSTPKALRLYGIEDTQYHNDVEMFDYIHEMRTRIITNPAFTSQHILAAILFENTMDRKICGEYSGDYLWNVKGILPILKVDKGLAPLTHGVALMKPIINLDQLLIKAQQRHIFATKMRSFIKEVNPVGIAELVEQQFAIAHQIALSGFIPIIEPEIDIHASDKQQCETLLKKELKEHLSSLPMDCKVMFKLTLPNLPNFYQDLMEDVHVIRVVALSGGYSRDVANEKLAQNHGIIASFSRALTQGLRIDQSDDEFHALLQASIQSIYDASIQ